MTSRRTSLWITVAGCAAAMAALAGCSGTDVSTTGAPPVGGGSDKTKTTSASARPVNDPRAAAVGGLIDLNVATTTSTAPPETVATTAPPVTIATTAPPVTTPGATTPKVTTAPVTAPPVTQAPVTRPPVTTKPAPVEISAAGLSADEQTAFNTMNAARNGLGVPSMKLEQNSMNVARQHVQTMAAAKHVSGITDDLFQLIPVNVTSFNVVVGSNTPTEWIAQVKSQVANYNGTFTWAGIGVMSNAGIQYWTFVVSS